LELFFSESSSVCLLATHMPLCCDKDS